MDTVLTDDEISQAGKDCFWPLDEDAPKFARVIEAAVLAKLREQEPVADLRNAKWLDPECAEAGCCQSLRFKSAATEAPAPLNPAYRIAPVDPTMEMIDAGAQRLVSWGESSVWPDSWDALQVEAARTEADRCWRSMILAAPEAPAQEGKK